MSGSRRFAILIFLISASISASTCLADESKKPFCGVVAGESKPERTLNLRKYLRSNELLQALLAEYVPKPETTVESKPWVQTRDLQLSWIFIRHKLTEIVYSPETFGGIGPPIASATIANNSKVLSCFFATNQNIYEDAFDSRHFDDEHGRHLAFGDEYVSVEMTFQSGRLITIKVLEVG